jgi:hypothetical protein
MNLLLRPLNDVNDVTWSIIISLIILLAGTAYYIYTIMSLAFKELEDDGQVREQGQEGICEQQEAEPGQCDSKES